MKSPKVSVILCNFNYARFVGPAIESVLHQTFEDWELIVVDDGSTDASWEVISRYRDQRITAVRQENAGQAGAFNKGFELSCGELVAFLDSDDLFKPEKLSVLVHAFQHAPTCSLVQHLLDVVDENMRPVGDVHVKLRPGFRNILKLYGEKPDTGYFSSTSGLLIPRKVLERLFPLDTSEWRICADVALTRPLPIFGPVLTLDQSLGFYRIHGANNWMNTAARNENRLASKVKYINYTNACLERFGCAQRLAVPFPSARLRRDGVKSIMLYGAGEHTQFLLASKTVPSDFSIVAILDDAKAGGTLDGLPILHPSEADAHPYDAVVISCDSQEETLFRRAIQLGLHPVYTLYSWIQASRDHEEAYRNLARQLQQDGRRAIALLGAGLYAHNLLMNDVFPAENRVVCLLDENPPPSGRLLHVPVLHPRDAGRVVFDAVIIASDAMTAVLKGKAVSYGLAPLYIPRVNPNEIHVVYDLLRKSMESGVMIDVGAHFGGSLLKFAQAGWKVFAFEPDPVNRKRLLKTCRNFPMVCIDTRAVSNEEKENVPFFRSDVSSGISGLSAFHVSHSQSGHVTLTTLRAVCRDQGINAIDFLKVDTEGFDFFVLQGIPWESVRPRVIVCEFEDRKTQPLGYDFKNMADYLKSKGYHVLVSEWYPVLQYGTQHTWRRFEVYPCELLDREAFGNFIAVQSEEDLGRLMELTSIYQPRQELFEC